MSGVSAESLTGELSPLSPVEKMLRGKATSRYHHESSAICSEDPSVFVDRRVSAVHRVWD
jgi:hypothetical protein